MLLLQSSAALAVNPLVVDDAGTVDPCQLQLNAGWRYARTSSREPLRRAGESGARSQRAAERSASRPATSVRAVGIRWPTGASDVLLSSKWQLWQSKAGFQLSARVDVKLPAASEREGLGTGDTDLGWVLIATRCWGRTCLDWNAGYVVAGLSRGVSADDTWFFGQAVRIDLGARWTLLAEIFGLVPAGDLAPPSEVRFNGGPQFAVHENLLVSALIGSAAGRGSPDLTSYVGLTWTF